MHDDEKVDLDSSPAIQDTDVIVYRAQDASELPQALADIIAGGNAAKDRDDLDDLSKRVIEGIDEDRETMGEYLEKYNKALKLARMKPDEANKSFPFQGASRVMMPYVLEAASEFWARTVPGLIERKDICHIELFGKEDQERQDRAERIATFTNYDLRSGIKNWRESQSRAMLSLPIVGMFFKKTWHSPTEERRKSQVLYADQLICDHTKQDFSRCPRRSYEYDMGMNEVISAVRSGQFLEHDYDPEEQDGLTYIESHCALDLDDDGYSEPYIVTICKETNEIVSIVPRFQVEDVTVTEKGDVVEIEGEQFFSITTFMPDPCGTWLGMGWGILLGDLFESINTNIRQLTDAGTLQNISANSGFISVGGGNPTNRKKKGRYELIMGQFTAIESSGPINQSIWQPQFAGPSATLFQLLESLKEDARRLVTISQNVEGNPNEAAELYLARLQQSLKLPQAIMINVYNGVTRELKRLYDIYQRYLDPDEYKEIVGEEFDPIADFGDDDMDIKPTSDPTQGSEEERISKATIILNEAKQSPVFDLRAAYNNYFQAIGVSNPEVYLPEPQPNEPDPLAVMQAQAAADMGKAEKMKGMADMMGAQADMMEAQMKMQKLEAEIAKMESETMKNLAEVDSKEMQTRIDMLKANIEATRGIFDDARKLFETDSKASQAMAAQSGVQGTGAGVQESPRQPSTGSNGMAGQ